MTSPDSDPTTFPREIGNLKVAVRVEESDVNIYIATQMANSDSF